MLHLCKTNFPNKSSQNVPVTQICQLGNLFLQRSYCGRSQFTKSRGKVSQAARRSAMFSQFDHVAGELHAIVKWHNPIQFSLWSDSGCQNVWDAPVPSHHHHKRKTNADTFCTDHSGGKKKIINKNFWRKHERESVMISSLMLAWTKIWGVSEEITTRLVFKAQEWLVPRWWYRLMWTMFIIKVRTRFTSQTKNPSQFGSQLSKQRTFSSR